jgi:hypothetical protein
LLKHAEESQQVAHLDTYNEVPDTIAIVKTKYHNLVTSLTGLRPFVSSFLFELPAMTDDTQRLLDAASRSPSDDAAASSSASAARNRHSGPVRLAAGSNAKTASSESKAAASESKAAAVPKSGTQKSAAAAKVKSEPHDRTTVFRIGNTAVSFEDMAGFFNQFKAMSGLVSPSASASGSGSGSGLRSLSS